MSRVRSAQPTGAAPGSPRRRVPRDIVRAKQLLLQAYEDIRAGRLGGRRGEAAVSAARALLGLAERRLARKLAEQQAEQKPSVELADYAGGKPFDHPGASEPHDDNT